MKYISRKMYAKHCSHDLTWRQFEVFLMPAGIVGLLPCGEIYFDLHGALEYVQEYKKQLGTKVKFIKTRAMYNRIANGLVRVMEHTPHLSEEKAYEWVKDIECQS